MTTPARLQGLIEPIVTGLGLELFDLQFTGSTLSVIVDRPRSGSGLRGPNAGSGLRGPNAGSGLRGPNAETGEDPPAGLDLAAITAVSRAVSRMLDEADPISGHYSLEVSSPGLERPLRTPAHFAGAVGELVSVKTTAGFDGPRRLRGELLRAATADDDDAAIDVRVEGTGELHTVPYADIERARTVFEWGPEPKPTRPKPPGAKAGKPTKPSKRGPGAKGSAPAAGRASRPPARGDGDRRGPRSETGDDPPNPTPRAPGAEHRDAGHAAGGSATPQGTNAMINGDDKKVSAT
jgi:ribosome maturation factor RimP